ATVPGSAWAGQPWLGGGVPVQPTANSYFSVSAYRPDQAGGYRRQKRQFAGLYAVMLDDIGTKVPAEKITLDPSWATETSAGNFQVGFILRDPITDAAAADRLMKAIIDAGLCDEGAGGPTARLARLPQGINGKYSPPFVCQMTDWNPELRYSPE